MPRLFHHTVAAAALAVVFAGSSGTAQTLERYTAAAINMNRGAASHIEIVVNRWSTDAERDRLMSVMLERGPEKLLDTLQDLPRVGYFRRRTASRGISISRARCRAPTAASA